MREQWLDFYARNRNWLWMAAAALSLFVLWHNWLAWAAMAGGALLVYGVDKAMDDAHPLRDAMMVGALLSWAFLCWQGFDWIVKYESRKAKTFCGKIVDYESQSYPRQLTHYIYFLENQQGQTKSFSGYDYLGDKNSEVCLKYIPHEKSVFFSEDYVLGKTKD
ncbi:hypothetical protein [Wielerella bovis]|uniref:hypothetical protein n=1 Tax=Wielerella bovis TaxID=2917790 RepID=UPI0020198EFA|nr:hypothetical protein [Wielerella bovis]MCG7657839.1 hypothetical protein [Wielerella bovis]MCG7660061.1 hypothetical protein [Wielerella bovis]